MQETILKNGRQYRSHPVYCSKNPNAGQVRPYNFYSGDGSNTSYTYVYMKTTEWIEILQI